MPEKELFTKEKKQWIESYLQHLESILNNAEAILTALQDRQSILKNKEFLTDFDVEALIAALEEIDANYQIIEGKIVATKPGIYTISDPGRIRSELRDVGFEESFINSMAISEMLLFASVISSAQAKVFIVSSMEYMKLFDRPIAETIKIQEDQKAFEKQLMEASLPVIHCFQAKNILQDIFNREELDPRARLFAKNTLEEMPSIKKAFTTSGQFTELAIYLNAIINEIKQLTELPSEENFKILLAKKFSTPTESEAAVKRTAMVVAPTVAGAAIGSVVPVIGTSLGAFAGFCLGTGFALRDRFKGAPTPEPTKSIALETVESSQNPKGSQWLRFFPNPTTVKKSDLQIQNTARLG